MHGHVSVFTAYDVDLNKVVNLKGGKKLKKKKKKKGERIRRRRRRKVCVFFSIGLIDSLRIMRSYFTLQIKFYKFNI